MTQDVGARLRRRRIGTTSVVLVVGGAVVGAAYAFRTRERVPAAPDALGTRLASAAVPPESGDLPVASAGQAQDRGHARRTSAGVAYGIAVVLVLSGLGLMGVAMASQQESPPPPSASSAPDSPASEETSGASMPSAEGEAIGGLDALTPPREERIAQEPTPFALPPSRPVALAIPAIDVRSVVRPLGLTDDRQLETPSGSQYNDAGWYRHSPAPGSLGPSILLGHVDSAADGPSVFFRLGELRVGDRVRVTRADGTVAVFSVDGVRRFAKKDFPTKRVYGDIDHAGLRILTCGGPFDEVSGHYLDNVIVFASLVGE